MAKNLRRQSKSGQAENNDERPSKSELKRQSAALQKLGEELAALDPADRAEMNLPPELDEACKLHDRIRDHEGARRQRQFIGRLMREVDSKAIAAALAARRAGSASHTAALHKAEKWRQMLLHSGSGLDEQLSALSWETGIDAQKVAVLRNLTLRARETDNGVNSKNAFRQLFRELAKLFS